MNEPVFQNVVCAIDPRDPYASVLYDAGGLAFPGGHITVVSALARAPQDPDAAVAAQGAMERFVTKTLPQYLRYTRNVSCVLRVGAPADVILQQAVLLKADLVCVRASSHFHVFGRVLGSVTRELLLRSETPVLVVPSADTEIVSLEEHGPKLHAGRVVVPVDPGDIKASQLAVVARLQKVWSGPTELLYVRTGDSTPTPGQVAQLMAAVGGTHTEYREVPAHGSVAQSIWRSLEGQPAGLVVMGLERGDKKMQPGSIAYEVINHLRAVVLAVP